MDRFHAVPKSIEVSYPALLAGVPRSMHSVVGHKETDLRERQGNVKSCPKQATSSSFLLNMDKDQALNI